MIAGANRLSAQNDFYQLYGPDVVEMCSDSFSYFGIETSAQLSRTIWTVQPSSTAAILTSDAYSAILQFFAPGTYQLISTSTTDNSEVLSDTVYIEVLGPLVSPSFAGCFEYDSLAGCYQVCAFTHTVVSLAGTGTQAQWTITGADSYTPIPSGGIDILWGAGGVGSVVIYDAGCTFSYCFRIFPEPDAAFTTTPAVSGDTLTVCRDQLVTFLNQSTNGLAYSWQFGDGSAFEGSDASHAYEQPGYYTVTLTADGICDCRDMHSIVIEVLPEPAPSLDCINSVCPGSRQRYTAMPSGCGSYGWSVSSNGTIVAGGESSDDYIEVVWHEGPDGYITLTVGGCATAFCSLSSTFRIPVVSPDGPVTGDASVCAGSVTTYTAPYFPGSTYHWEVGPAGTILGEDSKHQVTVQWNQVASTTASWVLVNYDDCFLACGGNAFLAVMITPEIRLQGDDQVCENSMATVTALAGFGAPVPVSVSWQLEDASGQVVATYGPADNWTHAFNHPAGRYTWVAINGSPAYCNEIARLEITVTGVPETPHAILGETEICPGVTYGYTIDAAGIYATQWFVLDGTTTYLYEGQTFSHAFGPAPPYRVQAIHTDLQYPGCISDTLTLDVIAASSLVIEGPSAGCLNAIDQFAASYVAGTDYQWEVLPADHGEIRRSDLNEVEVFWTQPGPVTLRLTACNEVIDYPVTVRPLPAFLLVGPTSLCANETAIVQTDQPGFAHAWSDENGGLISAASSIDVPPGLYSVEVTDGNGCTASEAFEIGAWPAPIVHLSSPDDVFYCNQVPAGIQITANTDGAGYQYEWFQDNVSVGPGGPVFTVTDFGSYLVEVTNGYGCTTVSDTIVYENCCPPATCGGPGGGFPGGCIYIEGDFQLDKTSPLCNRHVFIPMLPGIAPNTTDWVIESISEGVIAVIHSDDLDYTYAKPGYYRVGMFSSLTGYPYGGGQCGHYEVDIDTVPAAADFRHEGHCTEMPIVFEDLTTYLPGESVTGWHWDFGDLASGAANTSALQHPMHIYAAAGMYEVTLTVTLASGCQTIRQIMIPIDAGPVLLPDVEPVFCEDEALAMNLPGSWFDIAWDFGDAASGPENGAVSDSVLHIYQLPGLYTATVAASDIRGCRSQANIPVDIRANMLAGPITGDPAGPICAGDTATLTAPAGGVSWLWSSGQATSIIDVTESDQYNVLVRDAFGCTYSPPAVFVEVFPAPEVIIQAREILGPDEYGPWTDDLSICAGTAFELTAFSSGNVSYYWTLGEVTRVIQFTFEGGNIPGPGLHTYTVITTDVVTGCLSDSTSFTVEIIPLPQQPVIQQTGGSGCSFSPNVLTVMNPEPGIVYQWSDGQTGTSITVDDAGPYYVTAMNDEGCRVASNIIVIEPSARMDRLPGGCHIACDPLTVCLPSLPDVASYVIYRDGLAIESGTTWPSDFLADQSGSYTFEITSTNGCTAISDPLDVVLYPGVGSITVETWEDLDGDGQISAGDALLPGIPVVIVSDDGLHTGMTVTGPAGQFVFPDYPATGYTAYFDQTLLSPQWTILIDSLQASITTCGDSVIVSLLLTQNCTVSGPDVTGFICPGQAYTLGDSTWTSTGTYVMHLAAANGCDSVFNVILTSPDSLLVTGTVWMDVDGDGQFSAADTLLPGISLYLESLATGVRTDLVSDGLGLFGSWLPDDTGGYYAGLDIANLPVNLIPLVADTLLPDSACGQAEVMFLVGPGCSNVTVIQNASICEGDSLFVAGTWIASPGLHSFVIPDPASGCDTLLDVWLTLLPGPAVTGTAGWNCVTMGHIELSIQGPMPYLVQWGHGVTNLLSLDQLPEGTYWVQVTDANGCMATDTFLVALPVPLIFDVQDTFYVQEGESVLVEITGDTGIPGLGYNWTPAGILDCPICPAATATPISDTPVTIIITDADSCTYFLETYLVVIPDDQLYVPNVFSPNGDGVNDRWNMHSRLPNTQLRHLQIFDRWGDLVFSRSGIELAAFDGWDGTFRDKPMNAGVFTYMADLVLGDGRPVRIQGDITLLR